MGLREAVIQVATGGLMYPRRVCQRSIRYECACRDSYVPLFLAGCLHHSIQRAAGAYGQVRGYRQRWHRLSTPAAHHDVSRWGLGGLTYPGIYPRIARRTCCWQRRR